MKKFLTNRKYSIILGNMMNERTQLVWTSTVAINLPSLSASVYTPALNQHIDNAVAFDKKFSEEETI